MEQGWIKLYRKIEHNDFLMSDDNAYIVFTKLLFFVDRHDGSYRTGQRMLAERLRMSYGTLYKVLKRLENQNLITIENKNKYSKIWITNWTSYQSNAEIDAMLEKNTPLGKQANVKFTEKSQKKEAPREALNNREELESREAPEEAEGKRVGSGREDYNKNKELRNIHTREAKKIVEHYNDVFGREILLLDKRLAKIKLRFKNFTYQQVTQAIDNASKDDFFNGGGGRGWIGDLDYLVRSDENIEKYLTKAKPKKSAF
jgi:DNA-binding PadR family transcriptional regulator